MSAATSLSWGSTLLSEMQDFAGFPKGTQRYIRRSLDIRLCRCDPVARWSRCEEEAARIRAQQCLYGQLDAIIALIPETDDVRAMARLLGPLAALSAFDLAEGRLGSFEAYRFLYERLLGPAIRPWLPPAFCAAAALPQLHPLHRRLLLDSLPGSALSAPGWSCREPVFYPQWVEKTDAAIIA